MHHAFFCTFLCPFLHDYHVNMPNFAFYGGRKQAWIWCLGIQLQKSWPTFEKVSGWEGIISIKTERTQIHFLSDVLIAVASLDL